jgi:hypothetical protein
MLDVIGGSFTQCDGWSRREVLRVGALAMGGLTLPGLLQRKAFARRQGGDTNDLAVIHIFMGGGPSHIDMYDLKPDAPLEIRGEFHGIPTTLPGVHFCEHLPLLARSTDRLAIVRSITHTNSAHLPSSHLVLTGYEPQVAPPYGQNLNPYPGAVLARLRGPNAPGLPPYVALHRKISYGGAAFLGQAYEPFDTGTEPNDHDFTVQDLNRLPSVPAERLATRDGLVREFDRMRRDLDLHGDMQAADAYFQEAMALVTSQRAARAFDIEREPATVRERYGRTSIGQNCLLARRLVEAGVTFVSCRTGLAFDTHVKNFPQMREMLPVFDQAVSALVNDIYERGLAERVLVMAFGEFGRTPRINRDGGRDHWPGAAAALFAGGGLKVGQVVGSTDSHAAFPTSAPYTPRDVLATLYHLMDVDPSQVFYDDQGRPMPVLPDGKPIRELL